MRSHRYFWALAAVLLASCYDYGTPSDVVNGTVVITQQSATYNYAAATHYYLDPVAQVIKDNPQSPETLDLSGAPYNQILTAIDNNMAAAGFTKLAWPVGGLPNPPTATPNTVGLHITLLEGTVNTYYPGYWCDYWYYYSCYYSWTYAGSYNTGTMILEMGDLAQGGTQLPVAWLMAGYGVTSTAGYNVSLAVGAVNRAFGQSPYLYH